MSTWPPTLTDLKLDLGPEFDPENDPADARLQQVLDAAVSFVESVRPGFNYGDEPAFTTDAEGLPVEVPTPTADLVLGTLRLAGRWHTRRRSPDGLVSMGELGSGRVPSIDPDIEKLLRIGRWAKAVIG